MQKPQQSTSNSGRRWDESQTVLGSLPVLAVLPLGGAHLTNPQGSDSSGAFTGDACRYGGAKPSGGSCQGSLNAGVSGTYTMEGAGVRGDALPLTLGPYGACFPGYCANAWILCDMEVMSSGNENGSPEDLLLNEQDVNGHASGLLVPDGTWDDGGVGGACHSTFFEEPDYNAPGCGGVAHAEDAASGGHVWILAACDDRTNWRDLFGDLWWECFFPVIDVEACAGVVADLWTCPLRPDCGEGELWSCGADGTMDHMNLGRGGGDVGGTSLLPVNAGSNKLDNPAAGVPFPQAGSDGSGPCDPHAAAAVFVLQGVEANAGLDPEGQPVGAQYAIATAGWIDWSAGPGGAAWTPGDGFHALTLPECADSRDNDRNGQRDYPLDPGCSSPQDDLED